MKTVKINLREYNSLMEKVARVDLAYAEGKSDTLDIYHRELIGIVKSLTEERCCCHRQLKAKESE